MVSGDRRGFVCLWKHCGKSFHRNSDLRRHYRIHTNERPYRCGVKDCNKVFIQRSALTVHSRTHTGEKPFSCSYEGCHSKFSDSSSLARHRGIHTGERAYVCPEPMCKRSFRRKETLMNHQHSRHALGFATQTPSEVTTNPEQEKPYLTPITNTPQTDPDPFLQQEYCCWPYPNTAIVTHCFNFYLGLPLTLPTAPVAIQESRRTLL